MLRDIIEQVQNNDNKAMLELIGRFKPIILKYAKRLGSEDAYEDVILYFIELAKTMELNRLASTNDELIVSYICVSIRNFYNKKIHSIINQKREILFSSLTDEQSYYVEAQSAVYDKTDILTEYGILRCLNKKESRVIYLVYVQGYSTAEIAKANHKSRQAVNQLKQRALRKIRDAVKISRGGRGSDGQ